jgi:molybdopterin synthase catalytic subunit
MEISIIDRLKGTLPVWKIVFSLQGEEWEEGDYHPEEI